MARNEEYLGQITDTCLDLLSKDHETVDSVLARYPQYQETLRPSLEAALWLSARKAGLNLREGFLPASRRKLLRNIKQASIAADTNKPVLGEIFGVFLKKRWALQLVTAVLLIFILILGNNSVALAAKYTIPGDPLYPVKLFQEKLQLAFTFSSSGDARLRFEFAQRRLVELEGVLLEGRYKYVPGLVAGYQDQVVHAVESLQAMAKQNPEQALALINQMKEVFSKEAVALSGFIGIVPEEVKTSLGQILEITRDANVTMDDIEGQIVLATPTLAPSVGISGTLTSTPSMTASLATIVPGSGLGTPDLTQTVSPTPTATPTYFYPFVPPYYLTETPTQTTTTTLTATPTPTITLTKTPKPTNTHRPTRKPTKTPKAPKATKTPKPPDLPGD